MVRCYTSVVVTDLVAGVYDALRGALYLVTHPRLWKFVLAPAIVAAVILVVAVGSVVSILSGPIATLAAFLPGSWADNVLELLAGVVLTIVGLTLFLSIAATIAGPFNEMLSESIEERETGASSSPFRLVTFLADLVVGLVHAIRRVAVYLVIMLGLLILGIAIPVVGSALSMICLRFRMVTTPHALPRQGRVSPSAALANARARRDRRDPRHRARSQRPRSRDRCHRGDAALAVRGAASRRT
jgi:uncharacterized protein involved in cysteine biosynthesis